MRIAASTALPTLALAIVLSTPLVYAAPPSHAPAHGWRAKHVGHTGYEWEVDYGVLSGRCDRRAVATVLGGMAGAVIGNRVADAENRTVATIVGAVAGALIGNRIGRELDEADQACVGHALELGESGRPVRWTNESTTYQIVPGAYREQNGSPCREYTLLAAAGSRKSTQQGLACQSERGVWQILQ